MSRARAWLQGVKMRTAALGTLALMLVVALAGVAQGAGQSAPFGSACGDPNSAGGVNVEVSPRGVALDVGMSQAFDATVWCYAADGTATDVTSLSAVAWDLQAPIGSISNASGPSTSFTASSNGSGPLFAHASYGSLLGDGAAWIDVGTPPPPPPPGCGAAGGGQSGGTVAGLIVSIDPPQALLDIGSSQAFAANVYRCDANGAIVDVTATSTISWALGASIGTLSSASGASTTFTASANGSTDLQANAVEGGDSGDGYAWISVGADSGRGCVVAGGGTGGIPTPQPGGGGGTGPGPVPPPSFALLVMVDPWDAYLQIGDSQGFAATVYFCDPSGVLHDVTANSTIDWTAPSAIGTAAPVQGPQTTFTATANGSDLIQASASYGNETGWGGAWISVGPVGGGWGCSWIGGDPGTGGGGGGVPPPGYAGGSGSDPSTGTGSSSGGPLPPWQGGYPGLAVFVDPAMAFLAVGDQQAFSATVYECAADGTLVDVTSSSSVSWSVSGSVGPVSPTDGLMTTLTAVAEGCDLVVAQASHNNSVGFGAAGVAVGNVQVCADDAANAPPNSPGFLRGRVVDEGGAPVAGARIEVLTGPAAAEFAESSTAAGGEFRFVLPTGHSYRLKATAPDGREGTSDEVTLASDTTVVVGVKPRSQPFPYLYVGIGALASLGVLAGIFFLGGEAARLAVLLLPFLALSRIKREKVLDHFVRGQIYGYVIKAPGTNYSEIKRELKLANGVLSHHLFTLEREGFIKSLREGTYRRYFPREAAVSERGQILSKLQKAILDVVRGSPGISQAAVAGKLGTRRQRISYNMRRLAMVGLVRVEGWGLTKRCFPLELEKTAAA
jgi:DNA-binding MarR family transcriptional regulator